MRGRGEFKKFVKYIFIGIFFVVIIQFLNPAKILASDGNLVINEIYSDPTNIDSDAAEWIELYNKGASSINLAGYTIEDNTGVPKTLNGYEISGGGYLVLYQGSGRDFGFLLNNPGDILSVKNGTEMIDSVTYGSFDDGSTFDNAIAPAKGESISRIPNGRDTDNDKNDFKIMPLTKGFENTPPTPQTYSNKIIINEILPQPATLSDDEFIELYNTGADEVDISGWRLNDASAGSGYSIPSGTMISGGEYLVFCKNSTSIFCKFNYKTIALNDTSADSALLIDPNGDVKSTVSYTKTIRGQSYSLFAGGWQWTEELTPGSENVFRISSPTAEEDGVIFTTDIKTARAKEDGETVVVTGTVSVIPGVLSSQYFYIQDDSSGIQIYNYNKLFPVLKSGDVISVIGELTSISNERRIKTLSESDIIIIRQNSPPSLVKLKIDDLGEIYEGQLVEVEGTVRKTSGSTFYIHGSGEIEVIIRAGTGIKKPKMSVGNRIMISGILSQYQDHYRLLPISQDGVKILTSGVLPDAGSDPVNNMRINELWTLRPSQPARRKRLVTNLGRI